MSESLLPSNATALERSAEASMAGLSALPVETDRLWSAEDCPLSLLPYLAWALSVDYWDEAWDETVKRKVVASAAYVHRFKGTAAGVKTALTALDLGVRLSEWFETGGDRFTFQIDVEREGRAYSLSDIHSISETIRLTKNARSHLERLRFYFVSKTSEVKGGALQFGRQITFLPYVPDFPDFGSAVTQTGGLSVTRIITIGATL